MSDVLRKYFEQKSAAGAPSHACNCIGPQNGEPLCPCQMRSVEIVNGRYVRTDDLGPVSERKSILKNCSVCSKYLAASDLFCSGCGAKQ